MTSRPPHRDPSPDSPGSPAPFTSLAGLPFGEQRERIDDAVAAGERLPELLETLAGLRDHEPFAYAVRQLGHRGRLSAKPVAAALLRLLRQLPDTGVQRLLRGLERAPLPAPERAVIVQAVTAAMRHLGLPRLAAFCLMDRWLKNEDPVARQALCDEALRACRAALTRGGGSGAAGIDGIDDEVILRVSGAGLPGLASTAEAAGVGPAWQRRRQRFADAVLEVLESLPKSLSQANAEELLSRRVYTEPGHFLAELLQNAEDAGARRFEVTLEPDAVRVWHDGQDFDARDVVGVLSIGQTTKSRGQIGFFGVGFKSVYEICERPQVYSDVFRFEVADVSIPRRLARRPPQVAPGGTLIALPLRDPQDPARRPEALFRRARAVPPETLLTLEHLAAMTVRWGDQQYEAWREPGPAPDRARILEREPSEDAAPRARDYLVARHLAHFTGGPREATRALETPVLVAVRLVDGRPVPLPVEAATIYSHLPTGERPGFRFLLHAHFDLPIDRERLDLSSPWNRWAIAEGGRALGEAAARLAAEVAEQPASGGADPRLVGLLDVLPLASELGHPAWQEAAVSLREAVAEVALLPAARGGGLRPREAAVLRDAALVPTLSDVALGEPGCWALAPLDPRATALAEALGATSVGPAELLTLLQRHLADLPEGSPAPAPWLAAGLPAILGSLAANPPEPVAATLAVLPVLPDDAGRLWRPSHIARAAPGLRRLYGQARPLVADALEQPDATPLSGLLHRLGVVTLGAADLVADLADPARRERLLGDAGLDAILRFLADEPAQTLAPLCRLPLFPDPSGQRGPLRADPPERARWRTPAGPLGAWLRSMAGARPSLLDDAVDRAHGALLDRLDIPRPGLEHLLDALTEGTLRPAPEDLPGLHRALEDGRGELTPRLGARLAEAPLFPTARGELRALRGPGRALVPGDPDLRRLAPEAPWVQPEVAALGYLAQLGVAPVAAVDVVDALTGAADAVTARWLTPTDGAARRRIYGYLARQGASLHAGRLARLAAAPCWLDTAGVPRALADLRLPPAEPPLAALYAAWQEAPLIETAAEDGLSAGALAAALHLEGALQRPDYPALVDDLRTLAPEHLARLADPAGPLWPLLLDALNAAGTATAPALLRPLADLPLFLAADGQQRPLGDWATPPFDGSRCALADGAIAAALGHGSRPLLSAEARQELGPLLTALGAEPAGIRALVDAVDADAGLRSAEACARVRAAFVAEREALQRAFPPDAGTGADHPRLRVLPIWPARGGRLRPAATLVRPATLRAALGPDWERLLPEPEGALLDEAAAPEANALEGILGFRRPETLVLERLGAEARPGAPLAEQPAFLQRPGAFAPLLGLLHGALGCEALWALPVALDAAGCLVARRLARATPEEIALAEGLPLLRDLADPTWAAQAAAVDPKLVPPLVPRRLVVALAETARTTSAAADHPRWRDPARRQTLFAWLLGQRAHLATDDQALGPLGQACLFPNAAGNLVSPRLLVFDPDLPPVFAPERPAAELPEPLGRWLRQTFAMDEGQLDRLVDHLVGAHDEAVAARQGARSAELLEILARLLGIPEEGPLPVLPRRLKLHRRLRVETNQGAFRRPRQVLAPDPDHWALLAAFLATPPEQASDAYRGRRVRRLLAALGAADDLRPEALLDLVERGEGVRPGLEAGLALARYLALRTTAEAGLARALRLGERRFIPDGTGALRRPGELTWPTAEARAVLGDRPERYPHPEFFLTVPRALAEALPFRSVEQAPLAQVVETLDGAITRGHLPEALLGWLEAGLTARRLAPAAVREALRARPCLPDAQGQLRRPEDLFRTEVTALFGRRRGAWPEARRYRRLADALGIAQQPGRRDLTRYLGEIATEAARLGPDALAAAEPELTRCLPRCLARWVELGDPLPTPLLVAAEDLDGDAAAGASLCFVDDDRLCLPEPSELAAAARGRGVPLRLPVLRDQAPAVHEALGRAGCPPLAARWHPDRLPRRLPEDVTEAFGDAATRLNAALAALARHRGELPRIHPQRPADRWRTDPVPTQARLVRRLQVSGELAGVPLTLEPPVALEGERLVATLAGLHDLDALAETITRERLVHGFADPAVVTTVTTWLETGWSARELAPEAAPQGAARGRPEPPPPVPRPPEPPPRDPAPAAVPRPPVPPRRAAPSPPAPAAGPAPTADDAEGSSLLGRFRRWLRGDDADRPRPEGDREVTSPPAGSGRGAPGSTGAGRGQPGDDPAAAPPAHSRWFAPREAVTTQLGGSASWLRDRDRAPVYGFAFAPGRLPLPYLYAPQLVADRFDGRSQRWLPTALPARWLAPAERTEGLASLQGRIPAGELQLPLPLYGRLDSIDGPVRLLETQAGRLLIAAPEPAEISLRIALGGAPRFEDLDEDAPGRAGRPEDPDLPAHLTTPTVPDDELPEPVLAFVAALATSGAAPLTRALEVRAFVQRRYRYDPSYLEDPDLARWLAGLARGRANAHLALLHAGRDARHLGAGVCYELGVLACELLRRVGVPAAVATGWTLDRGRVDEPDHLWAMALLPSDLGPRWLPLDASTTRDGRPLHAADRPAGPWRTRAPRGAGRLPRSPGWAEVGKSSAVDTSLPLPDLLRVARHVERLTGAAVLDEAMLRHRCRALLDDPTRARALLDLLRGQ